MSEFINNNEARVNALYDFSYQLVNGSNGKELIEKYQEEIDRLSAHDVVVVVHRLVEADIEMEKLKTGITRMLNVFYKPIVGNGKAEMPEGHFLHYMMQENLEVDRKLKSLRSLVKRINKPEGEEQLQNDLKVIKEAFAEIQEMEKHYQRKENILFPYLEQELPDYRCMAVMWSIHDDIRKGWKELNDLLEEKQPDKIRLNRLIGDLFFDIYAIIFREEYLLFPVALNVVSKELWNDMLAQSAEIGYAFIPEPQVRIDKEQTKKEGNRRIGGDILGPEDLGDTLLNFDTGLLTLNQAMSLLNHLPIDITLIDEEDRVRYFSNPKDRFFTRSKAIIGRTVQNCHPPESVHMVNELLKNFKSGKKDSEPFWIQMKGRFILIQYYALRDEEGKYKGCIEVSQDITGIRKLEGEKRLLDE